MINIEGLACGYPQKTILTNLSLSIPSSQITVIIGPNGCGKSTLLKTICGILPIRSGNIFINHKELRTYTLTNLAKQVAYLAQNRPLSDITVKQMVLQGRFPYLSYPRRYHKEDFDIANQAMKQLNIESLSDMPIAALSGGTRQKVYIAMALAQNTPIILFDEPTTYLDVSHQLQMMEHAHFLCENQKTVVMVLHDLSMALQTADHIIVMNQEHTIHTGTPEEIFVSGCLDSIFQVNVKRIMTPTGWHYYYEKR